MITTSENLKDAAIHNAILDFSKKINLFTKDVAFYVNFEDSVFYEATLVRVYEKNYTHEWKRGELYDGIASVEIMGVLGSKLYYSEESKGRLPSRYVIKKGKLFYWYDDNYPVTDEMIAVLWKYDLLEEDYVISIESMSESKKSAHYYFCKNNMSKYKKIKPKYGLGFYNPPKVKCK